MRNFIVGLLALIVLGLAVNAQVVTPGGFTRVELPWTPTVTTDATVGTPAYSVQVGSYEQIGRQVTARFAITLSGWTGSPTGSVQVGGLPVALANVVNDNGMCVISVYSVTGLTAAGAGVTGVIGPNTTTVLLRQSGVAGSASISAAQAGTTPTFFGFCTYRAS